MPRRRMQAWVSCSGGRTTAGDPHEQRGEQCGPDLERSATKNDTADELAKMLPDVDKGIRAKLPKKPEMERTRVVFVEGYGPLVKKYHKG